MPDVSINGINFAINGSTRQAMSALSKLKSSMRETSKSMSGMSDGAKKFAKSIAGIPFRSVVPGLTKFAGALSNVASKFKRILFYRVVRSVIREISDAFKEGTNNLYAWSKAVGGEFAAKMDSMAASMQYFKNSIGAMVAPLLNALAPALEFVTDKAVELLNVINQFLARLTGASYWTKAIRGAKEYGEAVGGAGSAAKEALRYLAPFDELNRLPSDSGSGGGGGGSSSSGNGMFETVQTFEDGISDFARRIREAFQSGDWQSLGQTIGAKVNEIVESVNWAGAGTKVGQFINGLFTTQYWTLKEINFTNIGNKIGEFVNNAIANVDWDIAGRLPVRKLTAILDTIIGFLSTLDWGSVAGAVSDMLIGALDEFTGWLNGVDWFEFGNSLYNWIDDALNGVDWATLAKSIFSLLGSAVRAVWNLALGFNVNLAETIMNWWNNDIAGANWQETATNLWNAFKSALGNIGTWVYTNIVQPFITSLLGCDWSSVAGTATLMWNAVKSGWNAITNKVVTFGASVLNTASTWWSNVKTWWYNVTSGQWLSGIKTWVVNTASSMWSSVKGWWSNVTSGQWLGGVSSWIKNNTAGMWSYLKTWWSNTTLGKYVGSAAASIKNNVSGMWAYLKAWWSSTTLGKYVGTAAASIKNNTSGMWAYLKAWWLSTTAGSYMASVASTIKNNTSGMWSYLKYWWSLATSGNYLSGVYTWLHNTASDMWESLKTWWDNVKQTLTVDIWANWFGWGSSDTGNSMTTKSRAIGGSYYGGYWHDIPQYAVGGAPNHGSLFWAGESGAELVGHIGGRTEVLNQSQIASAISAGVARSYGNDESTEETVYRAMIRALREAGINVQVDLDGEPLYQNTVRRNRMNTRMTGVNALA